MNKNNTYFYILLGTLVGAYFVWYPNAIFSIDELSYMSRAIAFSSREIDLFQTTLFGGQFSWAKTFYPLGTSTLLSIMYSIHPKLLFATNWVFLALSLYVMRAFLVYQKLYSDLAIAFIICFLPLLFFARSLMSEIPSLALTSLFCWIIFTDQKKKAAMFSLGLIMGASTWFREANLVLLSFVLLPSLVNLGKRDIALVSLGFILGLIPRFVSAHYVYDNALYIYDYPGFLWSYIMENIILYGIICMILLPFGLFAIIYYKGPHRLSILLGLVTYIILHLTYKYNATAHSGFLTALFYNGRYMIPSLPLWIMIYAWYGDRFKKRIPNAILKLCLLMSLCFVLTANIVHYKIGHGYAELGKMFYSNLGPEDIVIYTNSSYRVLNPLFGQIDKCVTLKEISKKYTSSFDEDFLFVHITRSITKNQRRLASRELVELNKSMEEREKIVDFNQILWDGSEVTFYRYRKGNDR